MKIKIKSLKEIKKTLDERGELRGTLFNGKMSKHCSTEVNLDPTGSKVSRDDELRYYGSDIGWFWPPEWLEVGTLEEETERLMEKLK